MQQQDTGSIYEILNRRKLNTKLCCDLCGTRYNFDNMNMCTYCASVVCYSCVWDPDRKTVFRNCQCGGGFK